MPRSQAGKHVYCEKPLAPLAEDAREMADAAEEAGIRTQVGFNYLCNPMFALAREMIAAGEPWRDSQLSWDCMPRTTWPTLKVPSPSAMIRLAAGALADLGSHALATAEFLIGPITEVMGDCVTVIGERADGSGVRRSVDVDDVGRAFLRFANGASGSIEGNWIATGRKMQHDFEVHGSKGALSFSQQRFNELHYYSIEDAHGRQGFRRIEASPAHPPLWPVLRRSWSSDRVQRSEGPLKSPASWRPLTGTGPSRSISAQAFGSRRLWNRFIGPRVSGAG